MITALALIGFSLCCGIGWALIAMLFTENLLAIIAIGATAAVCVFFGLCWTHRERGRSVPY